MLVGSSLSNLSPETRYYLLLNRQVLISSLFSYSLLFASSDLISIILCPKYVHPPLKEQSNIPPYPDRSLKCSAPNTPVTPSEADTKSAK